MEVGVPGLLEGLPFLLASGSLPSSLVVVHLLLLSCEVFIPPGLRSRAGSEEGDALCCSLEEGVS